MFIKDNPFLIAKMEELCALLLEQKAYGELKKMLDDFAADEKSMKQYDQFAELGKAKEQKEHQGLALTREEMEQYNQEERAVYDNPVIRKYLFAQREFGHLQQMLVQYLDKTIHLGRLPKPNELKKAARGCGSHAQ
jgi:cell fate (sporulation/competence/biofilm development) regulator YlbF (YheA/YmcA/DUF963 family)